MTTKDFVKNNEIIYFLIKTLSIKKGLTLSGLSVKVGLDATALNPSKINGKRTLRVSTLLRIIEGLEITPVEFFKLYEQVKNEKD